MSSRTKIILFSGIAFLLGVVIAHQMPSVYAQPDPKTPKRQHGMSLKVRKSTEDNFTEKTQKIGVEVFRDENNGNLIYIAENGSIAVVPGK
jgi:hypothetical protein